MKRVAGRKIAVHISKTENVLISGTLPDISIWKPLNRPIASGRVACLYCRRTRSWSSVRVYAIIAQHYTHFLRVHLNSNHITNFKALLATTLTRIGLIGYPSL
jgi:hypothetical protein